MIFEDTRCYSSNPLPPRGWVDVYEPFIPMMPNGKRMGFEKFWKETWTPTFVRMLATRENFEIAINNSTTNKGD